MQVLVEHHYHMLTLGRKVLQCVCINLHGRNFIIKNLMVQHYVHTDINKIFIRMFLNYGM